MHAIVECEHSEDSGVQLTFCDVDDIDGVISSVSRRLPDLPVNSGQLDRFD